MISDELILEGIAEAVNIGSGHGATAMSSLLGRRVMIKVPELKAGKKEEVLSTFSDLPVHCFCFRLFGELEGRVAFSFPQEAAGQVVELLSAGEDLAQSALAECAHIVTGAFVSAMANLFGMTIFQSIPRAMRGSFRELMRAVASEVVENGAWMVGIEVDMRVDDPEPVRTYLFFVPTPASLDLLAGKISEMLA